MQRITWTCHVCGLERLDEKISVHKRDISEEWFLEPRTLFEYVRYCNDNPTCQEKAKTIRLIKPKK